MRKSIKVLFGGLLLMMSDSILSMNKRKDSLSAGQNSGEDDLLGSPTKSTESEATKLNEALKKEVAAGTISRAEYDKRVVPIVHALMKEFNDAYHQADDWKGEDLAQATKDREVLHRQWLDFAGLTQVKELGEPLKSEIEGFWPQSDTDGPNLPLSIK